MFNFSKNKKNACPVSEDDRIWIENSLIWLMNQFNEETLLRKSILVPTAEYFPPLFTKTDDMAGDLLQIVSTQMDVEKDNIKIDYYNDSITEITNDLGGILFTQQYENETYSTGLYAGKDSEGKYLIALEGSLLKTPYKLIATLAHEIAHIKILGEGRLEINDEYLTDLVTVFLASVL